MPSCNQQGAGPGSKQALNLHLGNQGLFTICSFLTQFVLCEEGFASGAPWGAADGHEQQDGSGSARAGAARARQLLIPHRAGSSSSPGLSFQSKPESGVTATDRECSKPLPSSQNSAPVPQLEQGFAGALRPGGNGHALHIHSFGMSLQQGGTDFLFLTRILMPKERF